MSLSLRRLTIQYFWKYIKKYKWSFTFTIFGITLGVVTGNLIHLCYREIIDNLVEVNQNTATDLSLIWYWVNILIVVFIFHQIGWRIGSFCNNYFQPSVMRDIENDCYQKCQKHSTSFFANSFIGGLVSKTGRLVYGFMRIMDILYWDFYTTLLEVSITLAILFSIAPIFGWSLLIWCIIFIFLSYWFSVWKSQYDRQAAAMDTKVTSTVADGLTNFFNVKIFARFHHEKERFGQTSQERYIVRKWAWDLNTYFEVFQGISMSVLSIILIYFCVTLWQAGNISIGSLVLVNTLSVQLFQKFWGFGRQIRDMAESFTNCEEMIEILHTPQEIQDPQKPEPCRIQKGEITWKEVGFSYEDHDRVFEHFDLNIKPGEKIGLVGESGSGKSTFTKLLLRFHDLQEGEILIDGQNIAHITQDDLRSQIAFVPQEPILFHRSLEENIRYGDLSATTEAVQEAAKKAHAHEFITRTKEGYQTYVGERGIKLSGGEKQRVAIARAMLKKAPILILDEATSSLDSKAETFIQDALENLMKERTTIVIAHRLSTIQKMDRILVFDHGRIVEQGTHQELLEKKGTYHELWSHQFHGFIE